MFTYFPSTSSATFGINLFNDMTYNVQIEIQNQPPITHSKDKYLKKTPGYYHPNNGVFTYLFSISNTTHQDFVNRYFPSSCRGAIPPSASHSRSPM